MILGKDVSNHDEKQQQGQRFLEVGKVYEVPVGKLKHVEVQGKEIVISNIDGKFYAMDDRCGHMNATTAFSHEGMHADV